MELRSPHWGFTDSRLAAPGDAPSYRWRGDLPRRAEGVASTDRERSGEGVPMPSSEAAFIHMENGHL